MSAIFLETKDIYKRFQAVQALESVSVSIIAGEIHALIGENGAGKSTLGKIIAGVHQHDSGELVVNGHEVSYNNPNDALLDGITTITQEISLLTKQTVLENVLLGQEITRRGMLNKSAMCQEYQRVQEMTGFHIAPDIKVRDLRIADQKKVEVMQAVARNAQLIIMDEPTAMLADDETRIFLDIVRQLKGMGRTIIYVSHFLQEVLDIADRVTIMRNGQVVRTAHTKDETPETLVTAMLGKTVDQMYPPKSTPSETAPVVFEVSDLTTFVFKDLNLSVKAGEIVGLAGLVGSGRSRLARTLFGAEQIMSGTIKVHDETIRLRTTEDAIRTGIYMLPESRKDQGLLLKQSMLMNMSMPHLKKISGQAGVINRGAEQSRLLELIESLNVQPPAPANKVSSFSGGNQQKILFGKWLFERPTVFIIDEPTRGIDVGAKQAIYQLIADLAEQGMAILMISSEIEEILGLAHRVLVMRLGQIVAEIADPQSMTETNIMHAAFGTAESQVN